MAGLAVHGNRDLGSDPTVHLLEFVAARVTRNMHEMVLFGDHLHPLAHELIVEIEEHPLVAGNDLGREDHRIPAFELQARMVAGSDAL